MFRLTLLNKINASKIVKKNIFGFKSVNHPPIDFHVLTLERSKMFSTSPSSPFFWTAHYLFMFVFTQDHLEKKLVEQVQSIFLISWWRNDVLLARATHTENADIFHTAKRLVIRPKMELSEDAMRYTFVRSFATVLGVILIKCESCAMWVSEWVGNKVR